MSRTLPALCLASQAFVVSQAAAQSAALGPVFEVNTYTTGSQFSPGVATDSAGNFVVVWVASGPGGAGIYGRLFDSAGSAAGGEFRINADREGPRLDRRDLHAHEWNALELRRYVGFGR